MLYQTNGTMLRADTASELVRQLHELSWAPAEDDAAWMEEAAKRTYEQTGKPVRFGTAEEFVADLLSAGVIKEIKS